MTLRVSVYAEGGGELGSLDGLPPRPGQRLEEAELGPAHVLVLRLLEELGLPRNAVIFLAPLRAGWAGGRLVRGSDLHRQRTLLQLLTWARAELRPDVAVVFVDEDGDRSRRNRLDQALARRVPNPPAVLALAVREFEAWLLADVEALREIAPGADDCPQSPEDLEPGAAKERVARAMASESAERQRELRSDVLRSMNLDRAVHRCPALHTFRRDLVEVVRGLGADR